MLRPATAVAGAALLKAAARARNQAFIVIVLTKENKKKMLFDVSIPILFSADNKWYSQELRCGLLQTDQEIDDNTENNLCNERDGNVDQGKCKSFDEGVVHRRSRLSMNNRTLFEESRNLRHGGQGSK